MLGREGARMAQDLEALADHLAQPVEDLRQVAARAALDGDGGAEEPDVVRRGTLGQPRKRLAGIHAELRFLEYPAELAADGIRHLLADELDGAAQRVPGSDGARHRVERVGELRLELLHPLLPLPGEEHDGNGAHDGGRPDAPDELAGPQPSQQEAEEGTAADIEEKVIGQPGIARLFGEARQAIVDGGLARRPAAPTPRFGPEEIGLAAQSRGLPRREPLPEPPACPRRTR